VRTIPYLVGEPVKIRYDVAKAAIEVDQMAKLKTRPTVQEAATGKQVFDGKLMQQSSEPFTRNVLGFDRTSAKPNGSTVTGEVIVG